MAFSGPEGPQVLPVNYVVLHGSIYFRTASGGTLANAVRDSRVAFEIDDIDDFLQSGWSVVAVGDAEFVDDPELLAELWGEHGPKPWAIGLRNQFVRITPLRLTGRRVLQT
ncbi:pyridoxamine 5'-phosphate oxidase family protein [Kribbella sp. CCNWLW201]